jgi:hypothetical protein
MKRLYLLILGSLLIAAPDLHATDQGFHIAGVGAMSCDEWRTNAVSKDPMVAVALDAQLTAWVQGFLSGMNVQRSLSTKQQFLTLRVCEQIMPRESA